MISVNLTGRLTRDPELRQVPSQDGEPLEVCQLRVAARDRRGDTVYLDAAGWGASGGAGSQYLRKGSLVAFSGELRFRETKGTDGPRQFISAVGHVEFLEGRSAAAVASVGSTAAAGSSDDEDDIPF